MNTHKENVDDDKEMLDKAKKENDNSADKMIKTIEKVAQILSNHRIESKKVI